MQLPCDLCRSPWISGIAHTNNGSGTTVGDYAYTFDRADRVTSQTIDGTSTTFTYDNTNQLKDDGTTKINYDANGNRTSVNSTSVTVGTGNRMINDGTWTYSYDDEGNITGKVDTAGDSWTYTYDNANHLTEASYYDASSKSTTKDVQYTYDAFGNRMQVTTTVGTTTTVERYGYDGWDSTKPSPVGSENFDAVFALDGSSTVTVFTHADLYKRNFSINGTSCEGGVPSIWTVWCEPSFSIVIR